MYGKKGNSRAYERFLICKTFGWDFFTYEKQPEWFITELIIILNQIAIRDEKESKRQQNKQKIK